MLSRSGDDLLFAGQSIRDLAASTDTPFFVFAADSIRAACGALRRSLRAELDSFAIRYAAKANHELAVLRCVASLGIEAMASHGAELDLARRAGFPVERLWLQRPVLSERDVRHAQHAGVGGFQVMDPADPGRILRVGDPRGGTPRICYRVRCGGRGFRSSLIPRLSGRMGMTSAEILELSSRHAPPSGLGFYVGTHGAILRRYRTMFRRTAVLASRLAERHGVVVEEIVGGGGLPCGGLRGNRMSRLPTRVLDSWPEAPGDELPAEPLLRRLSGEFASACRARGLDPPPRLVLEAGRPLVGGAGIMVTRVRSVRGRWLVLDTSRNHLPESPLLFHRRALAVEAGRAGKRRYRHLCGATVNTMDVIDMWRRLPRLREGDLLTLCGAGAYSISRATRHAGLSPPALWIASDGEPRTVRRGEGIDDMVAPMATSGTR